MSVYYLAKNEQHTHNINMTKPNGHKTPYLRYFLIVLGLLILTFLVPGIYFVYQVNKHVFAGYRTFLATDGSVETIRQWLDNPPSEIEDGIKKLQSHEYRLFPVHKEHLLPLLKETDPSYVDLLLKDEKILIEIMWGSGLTGLRAITIGPPDMRPLNPDDYDKCTELEKGVWVWKRQ